MFLLFNTNDDDVDCVFVFFLGMIPFAFFTCFALVDAAACTGSFRFIAVVVVVDDDDDSFVIFLPNNVCCDILVDELELLLVSATTSNDDDFV